MASHLTNVRNTSLLKHTCVTGSVIWNITATLRWRHNACYSVSNHQPHHCLLNRLFRRRSKKTSKLRVTGLCAGNSPGPVNSPHKWPVTRKMFPFDDVIMRYLCLLWSFELFVMSCKMSSLNGPRHHLLLNMVAACPAFVLPWWNNYMHLRNISCWHQCN